MSRTLINLAAGDLCNSSCSTIDAERDLVDRARRDPQAFAELYRLHYRAIATHIHRRTGDAHATEDLVADVFLAAMRALPRYRHERVPLRFWLYRIASNAVIKWARRNRTGAIASTRLGARGGNDDPAMLPEDALQLSRALRRLPPRLQTVVCLHHLEDLSVTQIALVMGCREGTVKSRLHRGRNALREILGKEHLS